MTELDPAKGLSMAVGPPTVGRRERNKQEKLDRIIAAASELFAEHGIDEVTTQQIADKADIGAGTLFLYAKTKGELLLLVQNAHYADALERGLADAENWSRTTDAVMAIVRPIVECNRVQVDNGRSYLREMAFGDPAEPRHGEALAIAARTADAIAAVLRRHDGSSEWMPRTWLGSCRRSCSSAWLRARTPPQHRRDRATSEPRSASFCPDDAYGTNFFRPVIPQAALPGPWRRSRSTGSRA